MLSNEFPKFPSIHSHKMPSSYCSRLKQTSRRNSELYQIDLKPLIKKDLLVCLGSTTRMNKKMFSAPMKYRQKKNNRQLMINQTMITDGLEISPWEHSSP